MNYFFSKGNVEISSDINKFTLSVDLPLILRQLEIIRFSLNIVTEENIMFIKLKSVRPLTAATVLVLAISGEPIGINTLTPILFFCEVL